MMMSKIAAVVVSLTVACCFVTGNAGAKSFVPMPQALEAMESDAEVSVTTVEVSAWGDAENFYYVFEPEHASPATGFILYPGAGVDPRAYAPAAHRIAASGYLTVIVKMPGDMGFYGRERAGEVIDDFDGITQWVIGGHSDGGAMACGYARDFTDQLDGVVIWASFPSEMFRLDATDLKVISIYGTEDGFVDEIRASKEHLPADTVFVEIQGGNHTQFGWYDTGDGPQPGDGVASITREEQQEIIIQATTQFLDRVAGKVTCPAAAALGAESPWLATLRALRDDVLSSSAAGRELVRLYYANAARCTLLLEKHPVLREAAARVLEALLPAVQGCLEGRAGQGRD